jgi:2-phosphosulfolactate phosphatase
MHDRYLRVHYLPSLVAEDELADSTVVVIDLLRASTTICQALASGAAEVVPFVDVEATLAAAAACDRAQVVLGGERSGVRISGFDLGNSPSEYTPEAVSNRRVLFTTTNGTRALQHARLAKRVLIGAMVNLSAVAASVQDDVRVALLCAGTAGQVTREDALAAGAIVDRLTAMPGEPWQINSAAEAARRDWEEIATAARALGRSPSVQLAEELRDTPGGRNLLAVGYDDDLVACAQIDCLDVVPQFDPHAGRIYLS